MSLSPEHNECFHHFHRIYSSIFCFFLKPKTTLCLKIVRLLAPNVLLEDLWPVLTIPSQSHPTGIWDSCRCSRKLSMVEGRFSKWFRVLKRVFWTFSYLYLWHTMWFHAKKLLKTLKFWYSLNSLCKSGSRPQKSPKIAQKTDHSIAIYSNFWIGMVYFGCHLVNPHVQAVQNMYGKGG